MAMTQSVASLEKRLSVSAAGFDGASRTRISSGSNPPSQAPPARTCSPSRIEQEARAVFHGEGVAVAGLKGKREPRQPHGCKPPSLRPRREKHERGEHRCTFAKLFGSLEYQTAHRPSSVQ
jgi:hypothetical protein